MGQVRETLRSQCDVVWGRQQVPSDWLKHHLQVTRWSYNVAILESVERDETCYRNFKRR